MDGLRAILGTEDRKWQALQTQQGTLENRHSANSYKVLPHATRGIMLLSGRSSTTEVEFCRFHFSLILVGRSHKVYPSHDPREFLGHQIHSLADSSEGTSYLTSGRNRPLIARNCGSPAICCSILSIFPVSRKDLANFRMTSTTFATIPTSRPSYGRRRVRTPWSNLSAVLCSPLSSATPICISTGYSSIPTGVSRSCRRVRFVATLP
jgi:hypothetical protein